MSKWVQAYESYICSHHLHLCQFALEQVAIYPLTEQYAIEYEQILSIQTDDIKFANKKCKKGESSLQ